MLSVLYESSIMRLAQELNKLTSLASNYLTRSVLLNSGILCKWLQYVNRYYLLYLLLLLTVIHILRKDENFCMQKICGL